MTAILTPLSARDVADRVAAGKAVLVDIREPDEFAHEHPTGAVSTPLSRLDAARIETASGQEVIFMCRSGARTGANCDRLAACIEGPAFVLDGGLNGWKAAGLPVAAAR